MHSGTAIYADLYNKFVVKPITNINNLTIELNFELTTVICADVEIISIYHSCLHRYFNTFIDKLTELLECLRKNNKTSIFSGNYNVHVHSNFTRAAKVVNPFSEYGFSVINFDKSMCYLSENHFFFFITLKSIINEFFPNKH